MIPLKSKVRKTPAKGRQRGQGQRLPGQFCFRFDSAAPPVQQRARFSEARKQEVKAVREVGACLRCQLLKKTCSEGNPCERCIRVAGRNHASRCLNWMRCFRPSLEDLYTIDEANVNIPPSKEIITAIDNLSQVDVHMGIEIPLPWTIDVLTSTLASEILHATPRPTLSVLGVLGSAATKEQASGFIDPMLLQLSRSFVYVATFLHTFERCDGALVHTEGLKILMAYMLHQITKQLDANLKPRQLAKLSQRQLECLFLILLGLTVAATYPGVLPTDESSPSPKPAGKQLISLLDHYLVHIGEQGSILPKHATNERLAELANHDWKTSRVFLLAYLRSDIRPTGSHVFGQEGSPILRPSEAHDARLPDSNSGQCDALSDYMEVFDAFINYSDGDSEQDEGSARITQQDFGKESKAANSQSNNGDTTEEKLTSPPFSKDHLDYVATLSSWKPVIDYHPGYAPSTSEQSKTDDVTSVAIQDCISGPGLNAHLPYAERIEAPTPAMVAQSYDTGTPIRSYQYYQGPSAYQAHQTYSQHSQSHDSPLLHHTWYPSQPIQPSRTIDNDSKSICGCEISSIGANGYVPMARYCPIHSPEDPYRVAKSTLSPSQRYLPYGSTLQPVLSDSVDLSVGRNPRHPQKLVGDWLTRRIGQLNTFNAPPPSESDFLP